ncbi:MAG: hypothetical protein N2515_04710, partial [Deltaproteobacteria bacterium]|nr:hypothetical protein [Deltaproteobacteria bacterium]
MLLSPALALLLSLLISLNLHVFIYYGLSTLHAEKVTSQPNVTPIEISFEAPPSPPPEPSEQSPTFLHPSNPTFPLPPSPTKTETIEIKEKKPDLRSITQRTDDPDRDAPNARFLAERGRIVQEESVARETHQEGKDVENRISESSMPSAQPPSPNEPPTPQ